jgi:hypothetical protein
MSKTIPVTPMDHKEARGSEQKGYQPKPTGYQPRPADIAPNVNPQGGYQPAKGEGVSPTPPNQGSGGKK